MEILGIIITIIIVIAVSAAKRKKPQKRDDDSAPPRPAAMSDIQKAFMMLSGLEDEAPEKPAQAAPPKPVQPAPQMPMMPRNVVYEGTPGTEGTFGSEGLGGVEGISGLEGLGSSEGTIGIEGTASQEGTRTDGIYQSYSTPPFIPPVTRPATIAAETTVAPAVQQRTAAGNLKLFENQGDIVRAVIYAEILGRRTQRR